MPESPLHKLVGRIITETDKAILFHCNEIDGNEWDPAHPRRNWFPISQVGTISRGKRYIDEEDKADEADTVTIKRWILQQKGIV